MFGIGSSRRKALYGAIFDVSSGSVGVALVGSTQDDGYPTIVFSHRVHMRITKRELAFAERVRLMRETLFSASLILSRDGLEALRLYDSKGRVGRILAVCSAPWSYTISRNVVYKGEEEVKITHELIHDLMNSAEGEIQKHLRETFKENSGEYAVVERATVDIRVNDYPIRNPIGAKGKEVSLAHVTGLIPKVVEQSIAEVKEKIFPEVESTAHTFMLVLFCVLREQHSDMSSLTIVHVSGETTEIGIIHDGVLVETMHIPCGLETLSRSMMHNDKETTDEIHSLLSLYTENSLSVEVQARVNQIITSESKMIDEAFTLHSKGRRIPKDVCFVAPAGFSDFFAQLYTPILTKIVGGKITILSLDHDEIGSTPTHDATDINLTIASRFFHKLHACGELET